MNIKKGLLDIFILGVVIGVFLLVLYLLYPVKKGLIILDWVYGLGYYFFDSIGLWHGGPSWIEEHGIFSFFCYLLWPIYSSFFIGCFFSKLFLKFWKKNVFWYRVIGFFISFLIFIGVIGVRGQLGKYYISHFGYSFTNY